MEGSEEYDLIILGWGAAAFSSAIKASELSGGEMKIAMIGTGPLGGTCVNSGCVPSKYLLEVSHRVFKTEHPKIAGIRPTKVEYSFKEIMDGLKRYVEQAREKKYELVIKGYENVTVIEGLGRFLDRKTVGVKNSNAEKEKILSAKKIIISTGSSPYVPEIEGLRETQFFTSDTIWNLDYLPDSFIIIGGGAIGLELGQALLHLGSKVAVIEAMPSLLPMTEPEISYMLKDILSREGMEFHTKARIARIGRTSKGKFADILTHDGKERVEAEEIIVASGRRPNTGYLELKNAGVKTDQVGGIVTTPKMETSSPNIYAAGDCVSKKMFLETLAAREGVIAVSNIFGEPLQIDYNSTAWAVFTNPQVAGVGMTEIEFSRTNGSCSCRTFYLKDLTMASIIGETDGLIKITVDPKNNRVMGIHILSPNATDIITEGSYAVKYGFTIGDIISSSHIFPSLSEGIKLAAQSFLRDISKMSCCVE